MVTQDQTADVATQNVASTSKKLILSKWWFYILLVLFIAIIGGIAIYLINQNNAKDISNFQITSITSESAAISWTTTKPTSSIVYLTDKNENKLFDFITGYKYFDFRDYQEISPNQFVKVDQGKYYNHYVVVSGLESSKEYSIAISDFVLPIDKFSQKFKTYSELETMTTPKPTFGAISVANEVNDNPIVTISFVNRADQKSQILSALASNNNTWTIDIANIRIQDSDELFVFDNEVIAELSAIVDGKEKSIQFNAENIAPCPDLIIKSDDAEEIVKESNKLLVNRLFAANPFEQDPVIDGGGDSPRSGGSVSGSFLKPKPATDTQPTPSQNSVSGSTSQQNQSQPETERPARVGDRCELDEDDSCDQNLKCIRVGNRPPTCQKFDYCNNADDCRDSQYDCIKNKCVKGFPTVFACSKNEECGQNQFCLNGKCMYQTSEGDYYEVENYTSCTKNTDCKSNEYCEPMSKVDVADGDIDDGEGACVKEEVGRACFTDLAECTNGMYCSNNECIYDGIDECMDFNSEEGCENMLDDLKCEFFVRPGEDEGFCQESSKQYVCDRATGALYRNNQLNQQVLYEDCDCVVNDDNEDDECATYMINGQVNCEAINDFDSEFPLVGRCLEAGCAWIDNNEQNQTITVVASDTHSQNSYFVDSNSTGCVDSSFIEQNAIKPDQIFDEQKCLKYGYDWTAFASGEGVCTLPFSPYVEGCESLTQYGKKECNEHYVYGAESMSCAWVELDSNNNGVIEAGEGNCESGISFKVGDSNEEGIEYCVFVGGDEKPISDLSNTEEGYCNVEIELPEDGLSINSIFPNYSEDDLYGYEVGCSAEYDWENNKCSASVSISSKNNDLVFSDQIYKLTNLDYQSEDCTTMTVCNDNQLNIQDEVVSIFYPTYEQRDWKPCASITDYIPSGAFPCGMSTLEVGVEGETETNSLLNIFKNDVKAQENVISDPVLKPGIYTSTGNANEKLVLSNETHIAYFDDANKNNVRDEGERILTPYEVENLGVGYVMVESAKNYDFSKGWNLVSFPFVLDQEKSSTANDIYEYLRAREILVEEIATYREGKFESYSMKEDINGEDVEVGNNFIILPGEAYFVKSRNSGTASMVGYAYENALPLQLLPGWNLVNIYKQDVDNYQAFDVLKQMEGQGVVADTLSKWENSKYNSVVYSDNMEYGYDYKVFPTAGYFVKVLSETGGSYIPE